MQLTTTWKEIFKHREMAKEGSASQSIKDMALAIQERRYKVDKPPLPAGELLTLLSFVSSYS